MVTKVGSRVGKRVGNEGCSVGNLRVASECLSQRVQRVSGKLLVLPGGHCRWFSRGSRRRPHCRLQAWPDIICLRLELGIRNWMQLN